MKDICKKYDVHLILDEVYCGTGTSGKIFCCDWDNISPDFIFIGKTLAAGYSALSAVITNDEFENTIKLGNGRIQHTSTHQGLSIGVAAALEVQKIIHNDELLLNVQNLSNFIKTTLINELADHDFFRDVRGRGLRLSFEYKSPNNDLLSDKIFNLMLEKYKIYISSKFHRLCLTPSLTINKDTVTMVLDRYIETFKKMSKLI